MPAPAADDDIHTPDRRRFWAGAALVVILACAAFWVVDLLATQQARERCLASGRRNCIDLALPDGQQSRPITAPGR